MGITSSTETNSRYDLFTLEKLHELKEAKNLDDHPDKEKIVEMGQVSLEVWWDGLHVLFPATKGELSTDQTKEGGGTEMDEDDQVFERFSDFMKEGGCKESFSALIDCCQDTRSLPKCKEHLPILKKCMDARISYYEPILALAKATEEKAIAFAKEEKRKMDLAAMTQAQAGSD
ncbi:hypothetical protein Rs2_01502 [Raphanus sativus]|uniref:Uncharacterized protein LOC108825445 n=1 Tax=Raphanus sativus TaxID=3726 RepID=A0A6J0L436_RAPSA|nr:uncharacterized protein LOC108825445 [Raphanus sativus]KAJ4915952.1 hypothetical protein Rs2_01502 [Raphanus sativus]